MGGSSSTRRRWTGADASPWQGIVLEGQPQLDQHLFDAPRDLLDQMQVLQRIEPIVENGAHLRDFAAVKRGFESAMSDFWLGNPASVVRAERALAELTLRQPRHIANSELVARVLRERAGAKADSWELEHGLRPE